MRRRARPAGQPVVFAARMWALAYLLHVCALLMPGRWTCRVCSYSFARVTCMGSYRPMTDEGVLCCGVMQADQWKKSPSGVTAFVDTSKCQFQVCAVSSACSERARVRA